MSQKSELIFSPLEVKVVNDRFDIALKRFRTLVQREGILNLYKEKMAYEKPSEKKNRLKRSGKKKFSR